MIKPKILILTDSLGLPRRDNKNNVELNWEETWISLFKNHFHEYEVISVSLGGASLRDLRNQINYYQYIHADLVILQCGIVDAAPRAFRRYEKQLINKLRLQRIAKMMAKFLRKYRQHHYASTSYYKHTLSLFKTQLQPNYFISLGIMPAFEEYKELLPNIEELINSYNLVLKDNADVYLSMDEMPKNGMTSDWHHLNAKGHEFVFEKLKSAMHDIIEL